MTSTHDHIEKTLADAYRKEIDQEENVWRSLPFFAATLAFQLAALFQMVEKLPKQGTSAWIEARLCMGISTVSTFAALVFLSASIFPAEFLYIAPGPDLLEYAEGLDSDEEASKSSGQAGKVDALAELKKALSRQYAVATTHNRGINRRRAQLRSIAGLATLFSVLATIALVVLVILTYMPRADG